MPSTNGEAEITNRGAQQLASFYKIVNSYEHENSFLVHDSRRCTLQLYNSVAENFTVFLLLYEQDFKNLPKDHKDYVFMTPSLSQNWSLHFL